MQEYIFQGHASELSKTEVRAQPLLKNIFLITKIKT